MQSERRDLEYTFKGLTEEQVLEKKRMLRESAEAHPEIAEYFRELAVDFCVRFPEEATKQRQTKEWEQVESAFPPKKWLLYSIHMSHIIHNRNLFIDTTSGAGKGDEFNLELGANMLQAADGQFMRLTLVNFNMYNNLYNVNATNNQFRIVSRYGPPQNTSQFLGLSTLNSIPSKNYKTCGDIALAFAQAVHPR